MIIVNDLLEILYFHELFIENYSYENFDLFYDFISFQGQIILQTEGDYDIE